MILEAIIIGLAIIIATAIKLSHSIKPRRVLAQLTVVGQTSHGEESVQLSGAVLEGESDAEIDAKLTRLAEILERRRAFCGNRLLDLTKDEGAILEDAKKLVEEAGLKVVE